MGPRGGSKEEVDLAISIRFVYKVKMFFRWHGFISLRRERAQQHEEESAQCGSMDGIVDQAVQKDRHDADAPERIHSRPDAPDGDGQHHEKKRSPPSAAHCAQSF